MDHLPDDAHTDGAYHRPDLLGALHAAVAAVGDDQGGLALPLVEEVVDGVLELGGDAPVALRREEDEAVVRGHVPGPLARVLVRVAIGRPDPVRDAGLVEDGQVVVFQVDEVDGGPFSQCNVTTCVGAGVLDTVPDEAGDLRPDSVDPCAADDDADFEGLGGCHGDGTGLGNLTTLIFVRGKETIYLLSRGY